MAITIHKLALVKCRSKLPIVISISDLTSNWCIGSIWRPAEAVGSVTACSNPAVALSSTATGSVPIFAAGQEFRPSPYFSRSTLSRSKSACCRVASTRAARNTFIIPAAAPNGKNSNRNQGLVSSQASRNHPNTKPTKIATPNSVATRMPKLYAAPFAGRLRSTCSIDAFARSRRLLKSSVFSDR